jgi:hypothetical protein
MLGQHQPITAMADNAKIFRNRRIPVMHDRADRGATETSCQSVQCFRQSRQDDMRIEQINGDKVLGGQYQPMPQIAVQPIAHSPTRQGMPVPTRDDNSFPRTCAHLDHETSVTIPLRPRQSWLRRKDDRV